VRTRPVCVGSGFVALDLILIGNDRRSPNFSFAGGSCGNVLTVLAYLGWDAIPVIRLRNDEEAVRLVTDLEKWSVNTRFIFKEPAGITPVVVQRICTAINGDLYHRFEWKCPTTGIALPRYRPLPQRVALEVSTKLPRPSIFYFDRVTKSALLLAKQAKGHGAMIFFEPSAIGDVSLFDECVKTADIIKYSCDRIKDSPCKSLRSNTGSRLEIQTLGIAGLRYAFKRNDGNRKVWKKLPAFKLDSLKDAAGAGDWCSAGIINSIGKKGIEGFNRLSESQVVDAMRIGQAMAAINCGFEGARGAMYQFEKSVFEKLIANMALEGVNIGETKASGKNIVRGRCVRRQGARGNGERAALTLQNGSRQEGHSSQTRPLNGIAPRPRACHAL